MSTLGRRLALLIALPCLLLLPTGCAATRADATPRALHCSPSSASPHRSAGVGDASAVPFVPVLAAVCRYGGLNDGRHDLLLWGATLEGAAARRLAGIVDAAFAHRWGPGTYSCPADFGSLTDLVFEGAGDQRVTVVVTDSGCRMLSDGIVRDAQVSSALDTVIRAAAGAPGR